MLRRLLFVCALGVVIPFVIAALDRPVASVATDNSLRSVRSTPERSERGQTSRVSATTLTTDTIIIPTYPYAAHLYTATNTTYNMPYRWLNWGEYEGGNPQPVDQTYTRLTLENDWLRVSVLPQLGGRVYELIDKATGNNELYRNPVIKPTNWGPPEQGWWLAAGGLEWGLPVEEHGYESAIPWLYDVITGSDGITITVRDSITPDRLRAAISIYLPNDRAVLIVRPRIENDRDVDLNFKWWDNAMLAPGPGNSVGTYFNNPQFNRLQVHLPRNASHRPFHGRYFPARRGSGHVVADLQERRSQPLAKLEAMAGLLRAAQRQRRLGRRDRSSASRRHRARVSAHHRDRQQRLRHGLAQSDRGGAMDG